MKKQTIIISIHETYILQLGKAKYYIIYSLFNGNNLWGRNLLWLLHDYSTCVKKNSFINC